MSEGPSTDEVPAVIQRAMSLLVNAAWVSPPLVDAARVVERYIHDVTASREWWRTERADAISLDLAALTAERDRLLTEAERHRNANLLRSVLDGYGPLDEAINEAINAADFDAVPWRISAGLLAERDRQREALTEAVRDLDAEHRPIDNAGPRGGCLLCWPTDPTWPCASRMVADDLRAALTQEQP